LELPDSGVSLTALERVLIERALAKTDGNQTRAAELLGTTRQTLIYRMEKHHLK
jgi:DNA-binding protein Fis